MDDNIQEVINEEQLNVVQNNREEVSVQVNNVGEFERNLNDDSDASDSEDARSEEEGEDESDSNEDESDSMGEDSYEEEKQEHSDYNDLNEEDLAEFQHRGYDSDELESLRGSNDEAEALHFVDFNEKTGYANPQLCGGMRFSSVYVYRKALKEWAIKYGYDYKYTNNNQQKVSVVCKQNCGFMIHASKISGHNTFQIKTFKPDHTCPRDNNNKLVGSKYIAEKLIEDLRDNPNYDVDALVNKVQRELGAEVSSAKCYRARRHAKKLIDGAAIEQYRRLFDYGETIQKKMSGSMVRFKTELELQQTEVQEENQITMRPKEIVVFQYMYVRFTTQKQGYFSGMRPIIGLDGCFLKTPMGGQILSAVARDGNENMYPLAMAMVDSECKASWEWFLDTLIADFRTLADTHWVFMSDRQKGLVEAMNKLMPGVEHRFCVKHMYENMKLIFKGVEYKNLLWAAAKAGSVRLWEHYMDKLKKFDEQAWTWVMQHDPKTWARCYFSTHTKSDAVQNNMSESFNSYIKKARDKPVVSCFEWIRKKLMKRIHVNAEYMKKYKGDICPYYQEKLEKIKLGSRNCVPTPAGQKLYSVDCDETTNVVNLNEKSCSCRLWDISGIPCKHVVSAIYKNREKPEQYVEDYFTKTVYLSVYQHIMCPIPSKEQWEKTELPNIQPWVVKKPAGRPKKKRTGRSDEPRNPYKVSKAGGVVICGNCKKEGHNVRGYTASVTCETTWQRRMRKTKNPGQTSSPKKRAGRPRKNPVASKNPSSSQPHPTKKRGRPLNPTSIPEASSSQPIPKASSSQHQGH